MHALIRARAVMTHAAALLWGVMFCALPAAAQSFNIDLDTAVGPVIGAGPPSSIFGAAAGQTGVWNSNLGSLVDLAGAATSVTASMSNFFGAGGFNNPNNTGDFALLMNDFANIGSVVQGGTETVTISGLLDGPYAVYTYGAVPFDYSGELFVTIPGSNEGTLMTSGFMTANTFTEGVTHVIHTLNVSGGIISIELTDVPGDPTALVNGFQIVAVPGPATLAVLVAACLMRRRRR